MLIPPIYWINLDHAEARRRRMLARFERRGLQHVRVSASAGDTPVRATIISHVRAVKAALADGHERALIFEDDTTFELFDAAAWEALQRALPPRFGLVQLCVAQEPRRLDRLFCRREALVPVDGRTYWSAAAYLVDRAGMQAIADLDLALLPESAVCETAIFGAVARAAHIAGPFAARVPLFIFEAADSQIHADHLGHQRRARQYILTHHLSLRRGDYRSPFRAAARMKAAADAVTYLPRCAADHLSDALGWFFREDEVKRARYLSQLALAFACQRHGGAPYIMWGIEGRPRLLDMSTYARIEDGDAVFVRIEDLARFNREILPRTGGRFVLFTGESDYRVPSDFADAANHIAQSGRLLAWFAQNYDGTAHRDLITPVPLGMNIRKKHDLHVVGSRLLARARLPVSAQEAAWEAVRDRAQPLEERLPLAFADFWLNDSSHSRRYGESRGDIRRQLDGNPHVVFPPYIVTHEALLLAYAQHAFVISPHGRGLDCYRTWEALFVGCIVIVKRSPLDVLYRDLPVVIVDDWREITGANLALWLDRFGSSFDRGPLRRTLLLDTWSARLRAAAVPR